jgi:hypothetical protein
VQVLERLSELLTRTIDAEYEIVSHVCFDKAMPSKQRKYISFADEKHDIKTWGREAVFQIAIATSIVNGVGSCMLLHILLTLIG